MGQEELPDALSFVNEAKDEPISLRPGVTKQSSALVPVLAASVFFMSAIGLLVYLGIIRIAAFEKAARNDAPPQPLALAPIPVPPLAAPPAILPKPLAAPDVPDTKATVSSAPDPVPAKAARPDPPAKAKAKKKAAPPVQLEPEPQEATVRKPSLSRARGAGEANDDQRNDDRRSARALLEAQGLKLTGDRFILASKEDAAASTFNRNLSGFTELHNTYPKIYQIDYIQSMINYAIQLRQGMAFDNGDLNIEMDSIPRRGGSREQYLNSIQRDMHNQLLMNRQNMNNLDRMIAEWRKNLNSIPGRNQLMARFRSLSDTCQQAIAEIDNEMSAVASEYQRLNNDREVTDALVRYNRESRSNATIAPSADFRDAMKKLNQEKQFFSPQPARAPARKGGGR